MFGKDLGKFIEENISFNTVGFNEDIYYNVKSKKFWIHSYFGNESLSPSTENDNILIFGIPNNMEWDVWNGCEFCENNNTSDCPYNDCMVKSLTDYISEIDYIEEYIIPQLIEKVGDDVDIDDLMEE